MMRHLSAFHRARWAGAPLWLLVTVVLAFAGHPASAVDLKAMAAAAARHIPAAQPVDKSFGDAFPKVDPSLLRLAEVSRSKGISVVAESAKELVVPYRDGLVAVKLSATAEGGRRRLAERVARSGGRVTATLENTLFARIPVGEIEGIGVADELGYLAPQSFSYADAIGKSGRVLTEGIEASRVRHLHEAGITGKGVKIGILDFGYERYEELRAEGEVPAPRAQKAFTNTGEMGAESEHGTACAEIIHDMAPDAELYLAAVGHGGGAEEGQIVSATNWLASQGVDIISHSGNGYEDRRDGFSKQDRLVEKIASERGILWVNSAGNMASRHWWGRTVDADGNGKVDVLEGAGQDLILFESPGGWAVVLAVWDDWGDNPNLPSATMDLDLEIYRIEMNGQKVFRVSGSENPQSGRARPVEKLGEELHPGVYGVALRAPASLRRAVGVRVLVAKGAIPPIYPNVKRGSVGTPASSRAALAVGAVHVDDDELASYSSHGPTDDGRLKPEVSAPSNTRARSYGEGSGVGAFPGTSASCPHVSGFAALLKQQNPGSSESELRSEVIRHVRPRGASPPNHQFGHGHIDGSDVAGARTEPQPQPEPPTESPEDATDFLDPILDILDAEEQEGRR